MGEKVDVYVRLPFLLNEVKFMILIIDKAQLNISGVTELWKKLTTMQSSRSS